MIFTRRPSVPLRSPSALWLLTFAPRNFKNTLARSKPGVVNLLFLFDFLFWLNRHFPGIDRRRD